MDGEWEAPMINNPKFKGPWKAKQITNPDYKGPWKQPEIDNPDYAPDDKLYRFPEICAVAFDLWQVKSGSIFDNILIGDDEHEAERIGNDVLDRIKDEKKMKEKVDEVDGRKNFVPPPNLKDDFRKDDDDEEDKDEDDLKSSRDEL